MADILIVDDEDVLRKGIQIILEKEGYNAIEVNDAIKAQQLLNKKQFDVVITDICMPRISGVELMKSIHNLFPQIKLILITGNPTIETAKEAIRSGAFDYLTKPVSRKELCQTVKAALKIKALETENRKYKKNLEVLVEEQTSEIKDNERKYRLLAENASDVIWTMDLSFNLTYISSSVTRLLGYKPAELSGLFLAKILSPEAYNMALKFLKKEFTFNDPGTAQAGFGSSRILEFEHIRKDGSALWAEIQLNYMSDYSDQPIGILGITRDISERKKVELELIESEENFRNLADNAIDGIIIALEEGKHVYVNQQATLITGFSRSELLQMSLEDLLAPEEYIQIMNLYKLQVYSENGQNRYESVILRDDQIKIPVELSSTKTVWHGRPADLIFLRDNSDQKRWENNLKQERDRVRQYLDIVDVILLAVDADQKVILINRKGREVLGFSEEEIIGKNWFTQFLPQHEYGHILNIFKRFLAGELEPFYYNENKVLTKNGEERIIAWRNVALHNEQGDVIGILSSGEDITNKLAMEVQLRSSEKRLNTIINSNADGIIVTNAKGVVLFANPAAEYLLGKRKDDIIGHPFGFHVEVDLRSEIEILHKNDSSSILAEMSVVDIEWAGKFAYLVNLRDITEQKKARDNILKLSQFQKSIIDNANVWLYVSNQQEEIVIWNKAAESISGYNQQQVLGNNLIWQWLYPDPEYRQQVAGGIQAALEKDSIIEDYETIIHSRKGEVKTILWYICRMHPGNGGSLSFLALGRDVSLQKETETKLQASFEKIKRALNGAIKAVILILETRDPYTSGHQKRVAEIAKTIALEMELPTNTVEGIYIAGSMHDIGKISVPVEILHKPGRLTETEFSIIKEHSKIGYDILKPIEFPWPVADIVYQHHEACNGQGYPRGLYAADICIEAKILAVADVIEAISADRPYRPALGIEVAIEEIAKGRGTRFDVTVADAALTLYHERGFKFGFKQETAGYQSS